MKSLFYKLVAAIRGKNLDSTPVDVIAEQMKEPRPLPMGREAFHEWSDRIISGALVPGATITAQKWTLANMLMHIGPTESHKPDAHYIHALRVAAIKEVAHAMATEIREARKAELEAENKSVQ